jgi:hypothetical protein
MDCVIRKRELGVVLGTRGSCNTVDRPGGHEIRRFAVLGKVSSVVVIGIVPISRGNDNCIVRPVRFEVIRDPLCYPSAAVNTEGSALAKIILNIYD